MSSTRAVAAARAAYGALLLLDPDPVAGRLGAQSGGVHPVLRILGVRHVVAAIALWSAPTRTAASVAAGVDAVHVASCLAWAVVRPSNRVPALRDAAADGTVLFATLAARPTASPTAARQPPPR